MYGPKSQLSIALVVAFIVSTIGVAGAQPPSPSVLSTQQIQKIKGTVVLVLTPCLAPRFKETLERERRAAMIMRNVGISRDELGRLIPVLMGHPELGTGIQSARGICVSTKKRAPSSDKGAVKAGFKNAMNALLLMVSLACPGGHSMVSNALFHELLKKNQLTPANVFTNMNHVLDDPIFVHDLISRTDQCLAQEMAAVSKLRDQRFSGQLEEKGRLSFRLTGKEIVVGSARIRDLFFRLNSTQIESDGS
ncbi:MAG TPA: hypothetical protein EYN06_08930, partial [Myxococcales bacterium]|nr:hypothetical protein [Myxococcales bacterium]